MIILSSEGGLAQLARAPALQAGGQRFESVILHPAPRGHAIIDMLDRQNVKKANEVCFNEHVQAGPPAVSSLVEGGRRPRRKYSRAHGGCLGSYRR